MLKRDRYINHNDLLAKLESENRRPDDHVSGHDSSRANKLVFNTNSLLIPLGCSPDTETYDLSGASSARGTRGQRHEDAARRRPATAAAGARRTQCLINCRRDNTSNGNFLLRN
ncbi:hypothetical protein EVAR_83273_1 [Eumeta japonica]|uniref:Uncharacterized protein n=1 Tax=Eumeta variegata TaxID=151549 RepID=A0A4C1XAY5_EUMVA|nr:hypothetical protein EVAR_83273_1 [Eumeta japonica]